MATNEAPLITALSSVPPFISPEEHRTLSASTPAAFADIPPIGRHVQERVRITFDPPAADIHVPGPNELGTLYIIDSALVYMSNSGQGFAIAYPAITLHAVTRANPAEPAIYCQLDEHPASDDGGEMRELTIVPEDINSVDPIFEALSLCASLHPDPFSPTDDDDDAFIDADSAGFEVFNGDEGEELSEVGRVRGHRYQPY